MQANERKQYSRTIRVARKLSSFACELKLEIPSALEHLNSSPALSISENGERDVRMEINQWQTFGMLASKIQ
jgi:hypothetical protein